jgi:hypothetical protein
MAETAAPSTRHPVGEILSPGPTASGIRSLSAVDYEGNANLVIVALAIGVGVIPIAVPDFYEEFPSWFETIFESGISAAAVTAVLLNLLFNSGRRQSEEAPIFAEGPAPGLTPEYQPGGHLAHEDAFTDTHRPTDVDQGPLPPRTVPAANEAPRRPDEESSR